MIGYLFSLGWPLLILVGIVALLLVLLILYGILRIFCDAELASRITIIIGCVIIGCVFPGLLIGLVLEFVSRNFALGVVIGGLIGFVAGFFLSKD